jgi:hypothetical protein
MWSAGTLLAFHLEENGSSYSIQESFLDETPVESARHTPGEFLVRSDDWVECVGQAVTASAFGLCARRNLMAERAITNETRYGQWRSPARSFASFVVDL